MDRQQRDLNHDALIGNYPHAGMGIVLGLALSLLAGLLLQHLALGLALGIAVGLILEVIIEMQAPRRSLRPLREQRRTIVRRR
jgi:hypothetical protein